MLNYEDINPSTAAGHFFFTRCSRFVQEHSTNGAWNTNSPLRGPDTQPFPPDQRKVSAPQCPDPGPEHFLEEKLPVRSPHQEVFFGVFSPATPPTQKKDTFIGSSTSP